MKLEPTLAPPPEGEELLAQANTGSSPFDFGPEPSPAPALEPNPFVIEPGQPAAPIGRTNINRLAPAPAGQQTGQSLPTVTPRGQVQPIPTAPGPGRGPIIRPAGASDAGAPTGLAPIPDPFELGLDPADTAEPAPVIQPRANQLPPANSQELNDPFSLELDPIDPAPAAEPIRSASATAIPEPAPKRPTPQPMRDLDFGPLPFGSNAPTPDVGGNTLNIDPIPSGNSSPGLSIDEPRRATGIDFLGDATIDRDVPRGTIHPQIQMTKSAPERAILGKPMVYEIKLLNTGKSVTRNVVVEDQIPRGTKLLGTIPQAEMPEGSKRLVWRFDTLEPGDAQTLKIQVEPIEPGSIGSIATVRFVAEAAAETHIAAPELKFRLVGLQEAALGETVTYKFEIANTGDEDARDVMVRCLVPQGLQSPNREPDLEYPVGALPAGESKTVDLPLAAIEVGDFNTEAVLEASGATPIQANSPIRIIKSRIRLDRDGPGKRFVDSKARFINRVSNLSSQPLTNVKIVEQLPTNSTFESASDNGQFYNGTVTWTLASLAPSETRDLSITFVPKDANEKISTVNATADGGAQTAIRARMTVVGFAALKVENDRPLRPYSVGEQVSMRMTIKNGGTAPAEAVTAEIRVPEGLRFVSAKGPVDYLQNANVISFRPLAKLANGSDASFDLVFECVAPTNDHLTIQLQSTDLDKPLLTEEAFRITGN